MAEGKRPAVLCMVNQYFSPDATLWRSMDGFNPSRRPVREIQLATRRRIANHESTVVGFVPYLPLIHIDPLMSALSRFTPCGSGLVKAAF
jgi:hypothetical protein